MRRLHLVGLCSSKAQRATGASLIEFAIAAFLLFVVLFGLVEFSLAFFFRNTAAKAVQQGLRIASVSDPVASGLDTVSQDILEQVDQMAPLPPYSITCDGRTKTCSTDRGASAGPYVQSRMDVILRGRDLHCGTVDRANGDIAGMCDIDPRIGSENVKISYAASGLGFAGRPGRPVSTITIELRGIEYQFLFLKSLIGASASIFPETVKSTATAEDLATRCGSPPNGAWVCPTR